MATISDLLLGLNTPIRVALLLSLILVLAYSIRQKYTVRYPANLPRVRENGGTRFGLKTRLAYYIDCEELFKEAYETYSKKGKTCLIPGLGFRDEVLLPHSSLKWLASQPDHILSVYHAFVEMDQAGYSAGGEQYVMDPWQGILVRTDMNSVLEKICKALDEELGFAFDEKLGKDAEWKEVELMKLMREVIAQASSRFTIGKPLCRDEEYLKASIKFISNFFAIAAFIGMLPKVLRPILGSIIYIFQRPIILTLRRKLAPLHASRLKLCATTPPSSPSEPQDHFQMMLRYGLDNRPDDVKDLKNMTARVAISNLGSFHQTTMAVTNMLLDILDSDSEYNTIALLREEIETVLGAGKPANGDGRGEEKGVWTKAKVAKLVKCDSISKETLRLNSFGNRSVMRQVLQPITTPDGIVLPIGAMVSVLLTTQRDEEHFPTPKKFIPFRFFHQRENGEAGASFVSLGEKFLPFGYGRHACPGRFLLDFELKMVMAHLLGKYDVELGRGHGGVRPESKWAAEAIMPPSDARIRVRRRRR